MRFGFFVLGPAGSGKSKFCTKLYEHCQVRERTLRVVNFDPAAENFDYPVTMDVRDWVSVQDVLEETDFGPNGGLVYAMEYLLENIANIMHDLDAFGEEEYFLFDCPGQIELYTHFPIMPRIVRELERRAFRIGTVYLVDAESVNDVPKFIGGALSALTASLHMATPHLNVLTKLDVFQGSVSSRRWGSFLDPSRDVMLEAANRSLPAKFRQLNNRILDVLDDYSLVDFKPFNINDPDSIDRVLYEMDHILQYGEEIEPMGKDLPTEQDDDLDLLSRIRNVAETVSDRNKSRVKNDPM